MRHTDVELLAQYEDAMLVPICMDNNMAAGNQRKHLALISAIKVIALSLRAST